MKQVFCGSMNSHQKWLNRNIFSFLVLLFTSKKIKCKVTGQKWKWIKNTTLTIRRLATIQKNTTSLTNSYNVILHLFNLSVYQQTKERIEVKLSF